MKLLKQFDRDYWLYWIASAVSMAASNSARILRVFFMVFPPSYLPAAYKKGGLFTELGWSFQSKL